MAELNTIVPVVIYCPCPSSPRCGPGNSPKRLGLPRVIEEYFIGGRSMGGFVLAMSIIASYTSASSFVGGPGVAYKLGLSWVLLAMIQVPTTFLTLGVLGKRFAIMPANPGRDPDRLFARSLPQRRRGRPLLAGPAGLLHGGHAGPVHRRGAALSGRDRLSLHRRLALFGLTVILYTAVGGFRAVVLTDAIQGMVMVFASVVVLVAVVNAGGGMERCVATLKAIDPG